MDWAAFFASLAAFTKALAWPIVTLTGLYWYKPTVSRLLDRLVKGKIGPSGAELEALAPNQSSAESPQLEVKEQVAEIGGGKALPPPDAYLDGISESAVKAIERDFSDNIQAQKAWIARLFAIVSSQHSHEETHRMIFGSQLLLLYKINASSGILPLDQVVPLYQQAAENFPAIYRSVEFGPWLNFLKIRRLLVDSNLRGDQAVALTQAGRSFLQYIIDRQLPERPVG